MGISDTDVGELNIDDAQVDIPGIGVDIHDVVPGRESRRVIVEAETCHVLSSPSHKQAHTQTRQSEPVPVSTGRGSMWWTRAMIPKPR